MYAHSLYSFTFLGSALVCDAGPRSQTKDRVSFVPTTTLKFFYLGRQHLTGVKFEALLRADDYVASFFISS